MQIGPDLANGAADHSPSDLTEPGTIEIPQIDDIGGHRDILAPVAPGADHMRDELVFESRCSHCPGKAALLESVRDSGSISAAAREMGMSYKRAWLLLDSMNQAFAELVVTAAPGGTGGAVQP